MFKKKSRLDKLEIVGVEQWFVTDQGIFKRPVELTEQIPLEDDYLICNIEFRVFFKPTLTIPRFILDGKIGIHRENLIKYYTYEEAVKAMLNGGKLA